MSRFHLYSAGVLPLVTMAAPAYAVQYLSVEEAQALLFPGAQAQEVQGLVLTDEDVNAIKKLADSRPTQRTLRLWKMFKQEKIEGYFIVDDVIGKHEDITYALAVFNDGKIGALEILEYRETHGSEVREEAWRAQFVGKALTDKLKIEEDINNISGATLSCMHVTQGVKRILAALKVKNVLG